MTDTKLEVAKRLDVVRFELQGPNFFIAEEVFNYLGITNVNQFMRNYPKLKMFKATKDQINVIKTRFDRTDLSDHFVFLLEAPAVMKIIKKRQNAAGALTAGADEKTVEILKKRKQPLKGEAAGDAARKAIMHEETKKKRIEILSDESFELGDCVGVDRDTAEVRINNTPFDRYHSAESQVCVNCNNAHEAEQLQAHRFVRESDSHILVPIHLDIKVGSHRFRYKFAWNKAEKVLTPESYARLLCDDFLLPPHKYAPQIANEIKSQLDVYENDAGSQLNGNPNEPLPLTIIVRHAEKEFRLNVTWCVTCETLQPEDFAKQFCTFYGLNNHCIPQIAIGIREHVLNWHISKTAKLRKSKEGEK